MSKVLLIHGPNLNLLGSREPDKYGAKTSEDIVAELKSLKLVNKVDYFQSNFEGELVNKIHESRTMYDGILVNAGAFSHTSVALADALRSVSLPKVSVHITNIYQREQYRHADLVGEACDGSIIGLGVAGYSLALEHLVDLIHQGSKTN